MFCRNSLKLRKTVKPVIQKARVVEPKKLNLALLTSMRAVWGSQSGGHGLNHLLDV